MACMYIKWIYACHMVYVLVTMLVFVECIVMQEGKYLWSFVSLNEICWKNFRCLTYVNKFFKHVNCYLREVLCMFVFIKWQLNFCAYHWRFLEIEIDKLINLFFTCSFVFVYLCNSFFNIVWSIVKYFLIKFSMWSFEEMLYCDAFFIHSNPWSCIRPSNCNFVTKKRLVFHQTQ